jgi:hypothetical protein
VRKRPLLAVTLVVLAGFASEGCSSGDPSADRAERGSDIVQACRGHGGVIAFDDDAVVCADQTARESRGSSAIEACRSHGGVSAFDDDIVVCRDESFHEAEGG